jgi:hypothetical protein
VLKIQPDEKYQTSIKIALDEFWPQFDEAMKRLVELNGGPPNPKHRGLKPFPDKYEIGDDLGATA